MATIDSLDVISTMLQNDGRYTADPQVMAICMYENNWGTASVGIAYKESDLYRYALLPNFIVLWDRSGRTSCGARFMSAVESKRITNLPVSMDDFRVLVLGAWAPS